MDNSFSCHAGMAPPTITTGVKPYRVETQLSIHAKTKNFKHLSTNYFGGAFINHFEIWEGGGGWERVDYANCLETLLPHCQF